MVITEYKPETEELVITLGEFPDNSMTEVVDFREFMDGIPAQKARIEYLLSMIDEIKRNRLTKIDKFISTIEEIVIKQTKIRKRMEEATEVGDRGLVLNLKDIHKALLDEKNTLREIRYSIKLLENEEGKLMAELLELMA